jgi:hypothetical protein
MLDFVGMVVIPALMVFAVNALVVFMDIPRGAKLILAAGAGLWIGLAAAAASAGWLAIAEPFPVIGIFVALPLAAAAIATTWPGARKALLGLLLPLLIGLNIGRVFAVLFLLLAVEGRLAGPFPYFAGLGDIITGVVAIPLVWLARETKGQTARIAAWNWFGAADLVLAIFLGVTSAQGAPLQLFHAAPGSAAMQHPPFSFVPTVLVPLYLILHAIIWVRLRKQLGQPAAVVA